MRGERCKKDAECVMPWLMVGTQNPEAISANEA